MQLNSTFVVVFVGVVLLGLVVMGIGSYNALVSLRRQVERAWANIDVILKQRYDEIPQLISVIEQYAGYEAGILKQLAAARSEYGQARSIGDKIEASQAMSLALRGIAAIGESYPQLKANENFTQLQNRISQLESTIADRREIYNEAVTNFNTRIDQFPDVFAARVLGYESQNLYQIAEVERTAPSLKMKLPGVG